MERELNEEFRQFNSSKIELDAQIEAAETAPLTVDETAPEAATAVDIVEEEAMTVTAEVTA